jgi:hypothetical protein
MSATELEDVQALLERVLPDPSGFAQRVLVQLMAQFGQSADPAASAFSSSASAFYTAATDDDLTTSDIIITPEPADYEEAPGDTNVLLAAALGACECWGLWADCPVCRGEGSSGWTEPVPALFDEFVRPAVARLPDVPAGNPAERGAMRPGRRDNDQTIEGERS